MKKTNTFLILLFFLFLTKFSLASNTVYGTVKVGNLKGAIVEIYEISKNGKKTLKWTEKTFKSGKFNTHSKEIKPYKYYLYKVTKGKDKNIINQGVIRAVAKGKDIQEIGEKLNITIVSEIIYEKVAKYIKYNFNEYKLETQLKEAVTATIKKDINKDGEINTKDILTFNPEKDKEKLAEIFRYNFKKMKKWIYENKPIFFQISPIIGEINFSEECKKFKISEDGTRAYIFQKGNLKELDITRPNKLKVLRTIKIPEKGQIEISPDGTKLYSYYGKNLKVIDISNSDVIKKVELKDTIEDLKISSDNKKVFVVNGVYQLTILDASNLEIITELTFSNQIKKIKLSEDDKKAFIYGEKILHIVEVSNLKKSHVVGFIKISSYFTDLEMFYRNKTIYILDGKDFKIIDISDPKKPIFKGGFNDFSGYGFEITSDNQKVIFYVDKYIEIIDIINPKSPKILGIINVKSKHSKLSKYETKIYFLNGNKFGVAVIDTENMNNPAIISKVKIPNFSFGELIKAVKNKDRLYLYGEKGIRIMDVSDSINPKTIGNIYSLCDVREIFKSPDDTKIYAIYGKFYQTLKVIDVVSPKNPVIKGITVFKYKLNFGSHKTKEISDGERVYIGSLDVLDATNPLNIVKVNSKDIEVFNKKLSADKTKMYVTGDGYFNIIDIKNFNLPVLDRLYFDEFNRIVSVGKKKIYLSKHGDVIRIVDISNIKEPVILKDIYLHTYPKSNIKISSDGSKIFFVDEKGLKIIDISNPEKIIVVKDIVKLNKISSKMKEYFFKEDEENDEDDEDFYEKSYLTDDMFLNIELSLDNRKLYVIDSEGFKIIDVSKIEQPSVISFMDINTKNADIELSSDGSKLYVVDKEKSSYSIYPKGKSFKIIDVSNPKNPKILGKVGLICNPEYLEPSIDNKELYVINIGGYDIGSIDTVQVVDISDIGNPKLIKKVDIQKNLETPITIKNKKIFIGFWRKGFGIVSKTDNKKLIFSYDVNIHSSDTATSKDGSKIYQISHKNYYTSNSELKILSVLDSGDMSIIGKIDILAYSFILFKEKDIAYVFGKDGVKIVDFDLFN